MTEEEARRWIIDHFGQDACTRLADFAGRVVAETAAQNLIAPSTVPCIWLRHILDSAQLLPLAPEGWKHWLDIGTGGGFPGMIIALLAPDRAVTMVEPRRKRAAFLQGCIDVFDLAHADVRTAKVEAVELRADVISARAVASVDALLRAARHCAHARTRWILPRGSAPGAQNLPPMFHVEHSLTDPTSMIVVLEGVK